MIRDGNKLGQSNLSAYWAYPNQTGTQMVQKDAEFVRWAKSVFSWVQRETPERIDCNGHAYRATKRVLSAVRAGEVEAVLY
jgi:hypothetical protein